MTKSYDRQYFKSYLKSGEESVEVAGKREEAFKFWLNYLTKSVPKQEAVLEVGCGLGFMGSYLNSTYSYYGMDISDYAISFAQEKLGLINTQVADAYDLPYDADQFSAIVCFDVVEHLDTPDVFIREAYRVLRPGGIMIITTPNPESFGNKVKKDVPGLLPSMYLDKTHVSLLNIATWQQLFAENGFTIKSAGTDFIWDLPYSTKIPLILQKIALVPINRLFRRFIGFTSWTIGENIVMVLKKK